ncbi:MAG: tRNA (5-methylaminomethyl-2-thiouridine)(34)-methyltransferase MnmD [Bacteroidales bacterium]|nr:tRNA (5-methylaminomethyl-2-thiouridine)(34)-methyltransferase MnmD [Bacteroidales bacterium]
MSLEIQQTQDGSHTLYWKERNEHYHSVHGSVQEARKVYIETALVPALEACSGSAARVFEMGFGTALNAALTLQEANQRQTVVEYTAIEAFPLPEDIWQKFNYPQQIGLDPALFEALHRQAFDALPHSITPFFTLTKIKGEMQTAALPQNFFHAIYYDAFAPSVQPELWQPEIFMKLRQAAAKPCFLSSYCAQGQFRRNLQAAGFAVERLPGPAGKREITRGTVLP